MVEGAIWTYCPCPDQRQASLAWAVVHPRGLAEGHEVANRRAIAPVRQGGGELRIESGQMPWGSIRGESHIPVGCEMPVGAQDSAGRPACRAPRLPVPSAQHHEARILDCVYEHIGSFFDEVHYK
jgi:hypothetical protein